VITQAAAWDVDEEREVGEGAVGPAEVEPIVGDGGGGPEGWARAGWFNTRPFGRVPCGGRGYVSRIEKNQNHETRLLYGAKINANAS